jgi:acetylornithine/N-succinyldiaminopimelate aminotransferase
VKCSGSRRVEVHGRGVLPALDLSFQLGRRSSRRPSNWGVLLNSPRPDTLRFMPAPTVAREEVRQMIKLPVRS